MHPLRSWAAVAVRSATVLRGTWVATVDAMRARLAAGCIALLLSWSGRAAADVTVAHDASVGLLGGTTSWFAGSAWPNALEIASRLSFERSRSARRWMPPLALASGVRVAPFSPVDVPLEVFVRFELRGRVGERMEPSLGPELGISGLTEPNHPAPGMPAGASALQGERVGSVYLAIVATPVRIRVGNLRLVFADFRLGQTFVGSAAVFGIGFLRAEYRL